jgi:hypothetical protein
MSRLVADQESRGGAGDSGTGEIESVMRMNLAEGCRAVNGEGRKVSLVNLVCLMDFPGFNGHLGVVVRTWEGL